MPTRLARKFMSPNVRSMLSLRASKSGRDAGECSVKSTNPNRINPAQIGESPRTVVDAEEVSTPALRLPTDGAKCLGVSTAYPML
jgi:hypothetical protein